MVTKVSDWTAHIMTATNLAPNESLSDARKTLSNRLVWGYLWHRRIIGVLGVLLPLSLWVFGKILDVDPLPSSLSAHFHFDTGPVFVATWCVVGAFLISYYGYHWSDRVVTSAGGIGAIGLAQCPTPGIAGTVVHSVCPAGQIHPAFVALFFISMIVLVVCIFTRSMAVDRKTRLNLVRWCGFLWYFTPKSDKERDARRGWKRVRDYTYMSAGLVMAVSGLLMIFSPESFGVMRVFWFETAAISAFGIAWFVKGAAVRKRVEEEARDLLTDADATLY